MPLRAYSKEVGTMSEELKEIEEAERRWLQQFAGYEEQKKEGD